MDEIKNYLAHDGRVNIICAETTDLVKKAQEIHKMTPASGAILGRLLTIGAIMGSKLKSNEDSITLQIKGNGAVQNIVCVVNGNPDVKGYMSNNLIVLQKNKDEEFDIESAISKDGFLYVVKDLGLKEPYVGIVPLKTGNISDEFEQYFNESEQTTTFISLGEYIKDGEIKKTGGFLVTFMPDATKEDIEELEKNVKSISISKLLGENLSLQEIAEKITNDDNLMVMLGKIEPKYNCECSKEKFKDAVMSLGKDDIQSLFEEQNVIETVCQFCGNKYELTEEEIQIQ